MATRKTARVAAKKATGPKASTAKRVPSRSPGPLVRPAGTISVRAFYDTLHAAHGPRDWWPVASAFELCVGAILAQIVAWRNAELALANLREVDALTPAGLRALDLDTLGQLIRPSGYWRQKAKRLRAFVDHLYEHHNGDLDSMLAQPRDTLREALLSIYGVGRETADCILAYAAGQPILVVDAITERIAYRLGWVPTARTAYELLREMLESDLNADERQDAALLGDLHAKFVFHGAFICKKRDPGCRTCPLAPDCPRVGLT